MSTKRKRRRPPTFEQMKRVVRVWLRANHPGEYEATLCVWKADGDKVAEIVMRKAGAK